MLAAALLSVGLARSDKTFWAEQVTETEERQTYVAEVLNPH
jgi:hypothetical protein